MGLSFLNPLFFIGLAGLAVPVLVHLVQSYRGERVRFPSLMFLDRVP
ncbi:BatA domain-containing protein, partial [Gemmatimonadota bacterium]